MKMPYCASRRVSSIQTLPSIGRGSINFEVALACVCGYRRKWPGVFGSGLPGHRTADSDVLLGSTSWSVLRACHRSSALCRVRRPHLATTVAAPRLARLEHDHMYGSKGDGAVAPSGGPAAGKGVYKAPDAEEVMEISRTQSLCPPPSPPRAFLKAIQPPQKKSGAVVG